MRSSTRAVPTLGAVAAICGVTIAVARSDSAPAGSASDPRREMITALGAPNPHPSLGPAAATFDRLVGTWDVQYTFHLPGGSVQRKTGELRFGWIMDGRALQDIWITYPAVGEAERRIGTSVRFFDSKAGEWRVVFVSPFYNAIVTVEGGLEDGRIVLRGKDPEGNDMRWSFNDLEADAFLWRGETSRDGGKTWVIEEEHRMRRRR